MKVVTPERVQLSRTTPTALLFSFFPGFGRSFAFGLKPSLSQNTCSATLRRNAHPARHSSGPQFARPIEGRPRRGRWLRTALLHREPGFYRAAQGTRRSQRQPHTTRGFISILSKKENLTIESTRRDDGERFYKITR
jgi:hypothetical protein